MTKSASEGLKKTLTLSVLEREFRVEVNFRTVDVIERAFDRSAEAVLMMFGQNTIASIRRGQIADVIVGWLLESGADVKGRDVREHIFTCPVEQLAPFYVQVLAALMYATRAIDSDAFDKLVSADSKEDSLKKKSLTNAADASSPTATAAQSRRRPRASASPPRSSGE